jgi:thioredoxin-like negative regulator of GroEL
MTEMNTIASADMLQQMKADGALFILFGGEHCRVCHVLRPQLEERVSSRFPRMASVYVDCEASPELCARHGVFSLPVVQVYIEGMKITEDARAFSINGLMERIERPYGMWRELQQD